MQPIQISEPNSNEVVFGIDLGTTNSLIAMVNKAGNVEIFKDEQEESYYLLSFHVKIIH